MKRILFLFFISAIVGCNSNRMLVARIDKSLDSLRTMFAPDSRTAVFKVTAEETRQGIVVKGDVDNLEAKTSAMLCVRKLERDGVIDSISVLPDENLKPKVYGIVDVSVASMYAAPRYSSELVNQLLLGHTVSVLRESHGWYYVKSTPQPPFDNGYLGWIDSDNLVRMDSSDFEVYNAERKIIVTSVYSTVRSSINGGSTMSDVVMADLLKPISVIGSSIKIELPDGRVGYVLRSDAEYLDKYSSVHKPTPDGIESLAREFIGFPYLWGGTSTKGLDCSGFVKTVFRMNDVDLPRDANQQVNIGKSVDPGSNFSNLKKGDLLFFGERGGAGKPEEIVHVGIYLGGGYFIHSSSLVRINSLVSTDSLFDEYELNRFVEAKRILPLSTDSAQIN